MSEYARARANMVDGQLRTNDVTDRRVLSAMREVARERFVPETQRALAYMDEDLLLTQGEGRATGRALMEPRAFAKLVQLAEIGPEDDVLDVGCATGYSSAILARLARSVTALECDPALAAAARAALRDVGPWGVEVVEGPLAEGRAGSDFDVIVLEGSVDVVPQTLLDQLRPEGRLVAVVGRGRSGRAMLYRRTSAGTSGRPAFDCAVAPLPQFQVPPTFVF